MKKGEYLEIDIVDIDYPNKAYGLYNEKKVFPEGNRLVGQKLKGIVTKMRKDKIELKRVEVLQKSSDEVDAKCEYFHLCGGCTYQHLPYEKQVQLKTNLIKRLLKNNIKSENYIFEDTVISPLEYEYRNKMEFTFGNSEKDGPLTLGLHRKGSFYDIVNVTNCHLVDNDFREILRATIDIFTKENLPFYHKVSHEGYLRNLIIRKGEKTKELSLNLVTSSQLDYNLSKWTDVIQNLKLESKIVGIIHTINDNIADAVNSEQETIIYGNRDINEEIFGLNFKISPYSFFQTNSHGIEKLYGKVIDYIENIDVNDKIIFDLFSGTGTIGQIVSKKTNAKYVYGVEIVEEAVIKANENVKQNGLENCEFIAGDVFNVLDTFKEKDITPDFIILDPPRAGVGEKSLSKIMNYDVQNIVYVSCNPKTLVQDIRYIEQFGYRLEKICCVDMFPHTSHIECVARFVLVK